MLHPKAEGIVTKYENRASRRSLYKFPCLLGCFSVRFITLLVRRKMLSISRRGLFIFLLTIKCLYKT